MLVMYSLLVYAAENEAQDTQPTKALSTRLKENLNKATAAPSPRTSKARHNKREHHAPNNYVPRVALSETTRGTPK